VLKFDTVVHYWFPKAVELWKLIFCQIQLADCPHIFNLYITITLPWIAWFHSDLVCGCLRPTQVAQGLKCTNHEIQGGVCPLNFKSLNHHNSVLDGSISLKFSMWIHCGSTEATQWLKSIYPEIRGCIGLLARNFKSKLLSLSYRLIDFAEILYFGILWVSRGHTVIEIQLPCSIKSGGSASKFSIFILQLSHGFFDFAKIGTVFDHITSSSRQMFKYRGSKVEVTA